MARAGPVPTAPISRASRHKRRSDQRAPYVHAQPGVPQGRTKPDRFPPGQHRPAAVSRGPRPSGGPWPQVLGPPVTGRFCAQDESARNAGGTPGCGTADGAARRTRGTQTGSPPVPAGRECRHPACGARAEREASAALALPVRTRNAGTRVRTLRTGSLAPRPALCRAAAARAAGCPMRSCFHGRTAVPGPRRIRTPRAGNAASCDRDPRARPPPTCHSIEYRRENSRQRGAVAHTVGRLQRKVAPQPEGGSRVSRVQYPVDPPQATRRADCRGPLITTITITVSWHPRPLASPPDR